jgi:broad specificity phosphatase PhoE
MLAREGHRFSAVWSSDLQRASQTAAVIAPYLGVAPVTLDPRLRESDAGPWQGLTPEEIELQWPGYLAAHRRPDGFEPAAEVMSRATAACLDVARSLAQPTTTGEAAALVVAHSGLIRVLRRHLGGVDDHRIPNLGGVWFEVVFDHVDGGHGTAGELRLGDDFGPLSGGAVTGVDSPGEDPSDEPDDRHRHRGGQRGLTR